MTRPRNFEEILSKLTNACKSGDIWIVPCSALGHRTLGRPKGAREGIKRGAKKDRQILYVGHNRETSNAKNEQLFG